ncbi:glycine--tRNA ligase subunit beta [Evansella tamaricis]|uniref:Glycine--tRNA ligase beta subunit n=1 Tax=Evansella tamaricis TaxID=2069301 RepID=A0ABS6JEH3_9BACI|nr:glycine--tRNA ligase subunit beta [Evansella tamaricis]MBU9712069.1 glycine--tRNA ligase subunit beta [Evansella tamaricis]
MNKKNFLLEIGLEEMPARFVTNAMNHLAENMEAWLKENRIAFESVVKYSTPRRLALFINGLDECQPDLEEEAKGPSKKIALDGEGNWTKAAIGFSKGQGASVDDLYFKEIKNEEYVFVKKHMKGKNTQELLTSDLKEVITSLSFPKNMKWGSNSLRYVRPIKWLVALYGTEIIPFEITNVKTGKESLGHRFLGKKITIDQPESYRELLLGEFVIVDPKERKDAIRMQIERIAETEGWEIPIDEGLLEEVTNLVEYPTALYGTFDERFLTIPDDVLITSMREHQRYFPVKNKEKELLPYFVTVRNGDHRHLENVQKGNEKVLRARLADAEFFYNEDLKHPLENGLKRLESIVYHEELGSMGDKVRRIKELGVTLGRMAQMDVNRQKKVERAAYLSKADLVTHMVGEFPELEGRMGEEYALKSGEDKEVAKAIYEHYLPKQSGDSPPETDIGAVISVADKVDTVVTSFGIGLIPTGSQDPHGLRRNTAGVIQTFLAQGWSFDILDIFTESLLLADKRGLLKRPVETVKEDLVEFITLRVKFLLQDQGVRYDVVDSVTKSDIGQIQLVFSKARFLMDEITSTDFKKVVEAFSRVTNIAKKDSEEKKDIDETLFESDKEKQLYQLTKEVKVKCSALLKAGKVQDVYNELKELEPAIHAYFDNIMVMTEDTVIKQNRLAQMKETSSLISIFADFQSIVFHGEE